MRRRDFIALIGGTALLPSAVRAQQQPMPSVGYISARLSAEVSADTTAAFREGLAQTGFVEGRNIAVQYHFVGRNPEQLPAVAAELVRRQVSVIFAQSTIAALAAKNATDKIPVVFFTGDDPVGRGLVPNFNRPGGNVTGVAFVSTVLASKRLQLLRSLAPKAELVGILADPSPEGQQQAEDARNAARALKLPNETFQAATDNELDAAFARMAERRVGALLIGGGPFLSSRGSRLSTLAARYALPTIYPFREFTTTGLMSYGASFHETLRQGGIYVGRILHGEKPGELPVAQPTKFELVINLGTAKALGIELPPMLLALADTVIE